ncbi:glycosyltransferase family 2 protein [Roseovarius sp. M141]|uniref:glycosyltransferase family 2 protein n=1 Tax=Roseovarius sp. M141 TaxID=2583806 RepID=UPI0020CE6DF1|nr:glycosyltransferase family 2 protein [Roseovarius sp. M141]MCQ0092685.1 glycosyltransferase family 2 protein [Roseovarius sp. M141]
MGHENSDVLIVVPTLNEERHIERCIRSLLGNDPTMRHAMLIVADGGSTDRTCAIVQGVARDFDNVTLLHNPDRLQSAAVNLAIEKHALQHHKYLVRCDAHSVYPANYVAKVVEALRAKDVASVTTVMDAVFDTCFAKGAAWIVDTKLGSGGSAHRGGITSRYVDHGHHAGMRIDWFRKVGGYDPTFAVNEDAEYDHRLVQTGGKIWLAADIRMKYFMRSSPTALLRQYFRYGRGRARTVLKHRILPRPRQMLPVINLILLCLTIPLGLLNPVFLVWPVAYGSLLVFASIWMGAKHKEVCGLWSGPALAIIHLGWAAGFIREALGRRDRGPVSRAI